VFLFLFLPGLLAIYYNPFCPLSGASDGRWTVRNSVLLLASLCFYAWGEPFFVFVMMISILVNWSFGRLCARGKPKKAVLTAAVVYNVGLLFVFKYLSFTLRNIDYVFHTGVTADIALPIGISFFTFQLMSYVFDVCRTPELARRSPLDVALYVSLFPQLIAGPIVRFETVAGEIRGRTETSRDFTEGMTRFVFGLGKKLLIANYAGFLADEVFASAFPLSAATAWIGAAAYTLQIYFDFSGYSDMAIGLGRMFGFHFEENFDYPYISKSITEFWRRWHISLSTWFRDYLYVPLGGSRGSKSRTVFNLFLVWLLTGVWHGANWTFIVWGLYYFVLLLAERAGREYGLSECFPDWMGHLYALFFITIGWVLFRSESIAAAGKYITFLFGAGGWIDESARLYFHEGKVVLLTGIIFSAPAAAWCEKRFAVSARLSTRLGTRLKDAVISLSLVLVFVLSILVCIRNSYNPFIYFNF
jgi:D-alanyl-lipoteichoic acid acyltransferase DltB (MBOAT superfamily)